MRPREVLYTVSRHLYEEGPVVNVDPAEGSGSPRTQRRSDAGRREALKLSCCLKGAETSDSPSDLQRCSIARCSSQSPTSCFVSSFVSRRKETIVTAKQRSSSYAIS